MLLSSQEVFSLCLDWNSSPHDLLISLPIMNTPVTTFLSFHQIPSIFSMNRLRDLSRELKVLSLKSCPHSHSFHRERVMTLSSLMSPLMWFHPSIRIISLVSLKLFTRQISIHPQPPLLLLSTHLPLLLQQPCQPHPPLSLPPSHHLARFITEL
jgi:hypothetical protein